MSTSGSNTSTSASAAAKNFFSQTHVIYIFNFLQNLIIAAVVTAIYTAIAKSGATTGNNPVSVPIDLQSLTNLSYSQVVTAINYNLNLPRGPPDLIIDYDAWKAGYPIDTLNQFLKESGPIDIPYRLEAFDCDDYAFVMVGRERTWFGMNTPNNVTGSSFAIISGDLRLHNETEVVGHAMNLFIDNYSQVWLIEPQTREIFKASQLSNQSKVDYIIM